MVIYKAFLKGYYNSFSYLNRLDLAVHHFRHFSNRNSGLDGCDDIHNERGSSIEVSKSPCANHSKMDNWLMGTFSKPLGLFEYVNRLNLWLNGLSFQRQFHPERN